MTRITTLSILLAFAATLWFWQGLPEPIDIPSPAKELPLALQHLNVEQSLDLQYHSGVKSEQIGNQQLTLIGGVFEQRFSVDLCSMAVRGKRTAKNKKGTFKGTKYLYVGLDLPQIKSRFKVSDNINENLIKYVRNPLLDQPNTDFDLPGFAIKSDEHESYTITKIEDINLMADSFMFEERHAEVVKHAFISNEDFTIVLHKKKLLNCELGQFTFDIYRHSDTGDTLVYYLDDITDLNSELVKGVVTAGNYTPTSNTKYGVQSLVQQMTACKQIRTEGGEWQYASRYHYNEQAPADGFSPIPTKHCQKVLATFYHTPAGNVVRKRAQKLENYEKPLIAISGENLVDVTVTHNQQPIAFEQGNLSLYQNLLVSNEDVGNKAVWHKVYQNKATFKFPLFTEQTSVYVLGDNIKVVGTRVLEKSEQCFKSLCDKKSSVMRLELAASKNEVSITATGIQQSIPLLKQNIAQLDDKPSIQHARCNSECQAQRDESLSISPDVIFSVVDRNSEPLVVTDIPHLLAPRGGRVNASMGDKVQLTIDKITQKAVQSVLENYMDNANLEAKFATLSLVNAQGEILALAQTPGMQENTNYDREGYKQSYRPFDSPLTFKAAYHDGGSHFVSGSVMKLLSALLVAHELGVDHPFIKGLSYNEWYQQRNKTQMDPKLGCYPTFEGKCVRGSISNFIGNTGLYTIENHHKKSNYGLKQAVRDSLNTYFSFMVNKVADEPIYYQQAYGKYGYNKSSKLRGFVSKFGFYSPLKLDAGLLGGNVRNTVFYAPASQLNYTNKQQFWRAAVGEQNRVTALQVAQFTLAIANEKLTALTLLKSIDDETAKLEKLALNIKPEAFTLVQDAMKLAAQNYSSIKSLPDGISLFAKSGTGEIGEKNKYGKSLNNVWMTAYLHPESPVVMTCQIVKVRGDSTLCAQLINQLIANADKIPALRLTSAQQEGIKNAE